ncbi:hypothetical protein [Paenibacillus amylolyticus]|nr:hypothetical protein [Paenibacillus amylolyticus]
MAEKSKTDLDHFGRFLEPVVTAIEARSDQKILELNDIQKK